MTQEERLAIIKNRSALNEQKETDEKIQFNTECATLTNIIERMKDHIASLLELANACVDNKIEIPDNKGLEQNYTVAEAYGYKANFIAEGTHHNIGLGKRNGQVHYDAVKLINGGACGEWNLLVDNQGKVFFQNKDERLPAEQWTNVQKRNLEQFIKQFPKLERAFFNYIESLDDTTHVWANVEWGDRSDENEMPWHLPKTNRIFIPEEVYENADNENEAYKLIENYLQTTYQAKVYTFSAENLNEYMQNREKDAYER